MESVDVTAEYVAAVERVARAVYPVVMGQVTGRAAIATYDTTITENREAARDIARAAIAAMGAALPPQGDGWQDDFIRRVCIAVAECPDRTSPEDEPDMMLVDHNELATIIRAELERTKGGRDGLR